MGILIILNPYVIFMVYRFLLEDDTIYLKFEPFFLEMLEVLTILLTEAY